MHPQMEFIRNLPIAEKLQILEELWEDLDASAEDIVPPWIVAEAERRSAELKANPDLAISEEELWRQVNAKLRDT